MSKLPMDLSKFKKVSSDKDTSTFRHYEGHEIKVAHNKLSLKMRESLHKLPTHVPKTKEPVESFAEGGTTGDTIDYDKLLAQNKLDTAPYGTAPAYQQSQSPQPLESTNVPVSLADAVPTSQAAPISQAPAQPPFSLQGSLQGQIGALQSEQGAQQALGQAKGQEAAGQMSVEQAYQDRAQKTLEAGAAALKPYQDQYAHLTNDIAQGHIDPHKYVNDMTTGGKISTGIGLILGGMGAGLTHGPNLAFNYLQSQIDRNIDAQKSEIGKKENLLSHNIQMMGNIRAGTELTRMQETAIVQSKLRMEAAKAGTPIAQANANIVSSQLQGKIADISKQGALYNLMGSGSGSGEQQFQQKTQMLRMLGNDSLAKDMEAKHVPGVGQASKEVPADVMKELISRQDLHNKITDLQSFASKNSGSLSPSTIAEGKAKAALVQDAYRRANAQGVFKESEKNFVGTIVNSDPTQFFEKYRAGKGYHEMGRDNMSTLNNLKQGYGLPQGGQTGGGGGGTEYAMKGGVRYQKVPGGWAPVK